jgi:hypothetical protein
LADGVRWRASVVPEQGAAMFRPIPSVLAGCMALPLAAQQRSSANGSSATPAVDIGASFDWVTFTRR